MHPSIAKITVTAHTRDLQRLMHPETTKRPRWRLTLARKGRQDIGQEAALGRDAPSTLEVLRWEQYRRMPWRNGGGVTHEIASSPAGHDLADFDWRISIAEVKAGGPFSAFPGIDRTIVLIEGEWMALTVDGRRHRFGVGEPFRFDGGSETICEVASPSRDLNVMTRRGRASASVAIARAGTSHRSTADDGEIVCVCLTPAVRLADADGTEVELGALDAAALSGRTPVTIHGDGAVAVIQLHPVAAQDDRHATVLETYQPCLAATSGTGAG